MPPSHSTSKTTHNSCNIFIWWPYLQWPWSLLSIRHILIYYLVHPLERFFLGKGPLLTSMVISHQNDLCKNPISLNVLFNTICRLSPCYFFEILNPKLAIVEYPSGVPVHLISRNGNSHRSAHFIVRWSIPCSTFGREFWPGQVRSQNYDVIREQ